MTPEQRRAAEEAAQQAARERNQARNRWTQQGRRPKPADQRAAHQPALPDLPDLMPEYVALDPEGRDCH